MSAQAGRYAVLGTAIAIVITAIIGALTVLGSPAQERRRRLDDRRVVDLAGITRTADAYWTMNGHLPASLDELLRGPAGYPQPRDPATGQPYGYRLLGGKTYELCADFQHQSEQEQDSPRPVSDFWSHGVGRRCFQLDVQRRPQ